MYQEVFIVECVSILNSPVIKPKVEIKIFNDQKEAYKYASIKAICVSSIGGSECESLIQLHMDNKFCEALDAYNEWKESKISKVYISVYSTLIKKLKNF